MAGRAPVRGALASATAGISMPGFVGRGPERAALAEALSGPAAPAMVLVEGEAGVGKSRLVLEYLASPAASGQSALVGVCPPLAEPFTLGPVVDAVRQARDSVTGLPLSALAGALRPLFPEWAAELPAAPEPLHDAAAARHRLFRAMAELVGCMGVSVLVVEDVHWADEATLEFLLFLTARQQAGGPGLLLTFRPADVPAGSLLRRLSARAPAGIRRVVLMPLDTAGTRQLVSSMLNGQPISAGFADFLHRYTDGLPLAIEESVRLLHDRADLIRHDGAWARRGLDELQVPSTIRDSVLERVARLHPAAQRLLQASAVLTDPADASTLATIGGLDAGEALGGIAEAIDSGLLRDDDTGRGAIRHMLTASAIYEAIPLSTRRLMHHRAAQFLETAEPRQLAQLARHYRCGNDISKWAQYAEQAADLAISTGDDTSAMTLLNDLLPRVDLPAADRARLARRLGFVALSRKSVVTDLVRRVVQTLRAVLDAPGLSAAAKAEVRNPLGRLLMQVGDYDAGRVELQAAIPHLRHSPYETARAMIYLGWPRGATWPVAKHLRWLRRAALVAPESIPSPQRIDLTVNRITALLLLGQEAGWHLAAEITAEGLSTAEMQPVATGYLNTAIAAMIWGRYAEAQSRLQVATKLAEHSGHARILEDVFVTQAHLDWFTGAWDGLADRVRWLIDSDDIEPPNRLETALVLGLLAAVAGDHESAERELGPVVDEVRCRGVLDQLMEPTAALARIELGRGRPDLALAITQEPVLTLSRKGIWVWGTEIVPARVEALCATRQRDEAAALVGAFARGLRGRTAPGPKAALTLCRAILAEADDDHAPAAILFRRAAASWQKLPRPYDALLARERQAASLLGAGRSEAGLALLSETHRGLADLGARADAERIAQALRGHGIETAQPRRRGRRGYGDQLSPREVEVVRLVAAGNTNREIAAALNRSPKTVATQLNSAMRKLNVSTRTALAVCALESGVLLPATPANE